MLLPTGNNRFAYRINFGNTVCLIDILVVIFLYFSQNSDCKWNCMPCMSFIFTTKPVSHLANANENRKRIKNNIFVKSTKTGSI